MPDVNVSGGSAKLISTWRRLMTNPVSHLILLTLTHTNHLRDLPDAASFVDIRIGQS